MMDAVWEIEGRKSHYWIVAEVYRNAHDDRTYVARIEDRWHTAPCRIYNIKFGFKTKRRAAEWAKAQRNSVRSKIQRARQPPR